MIAPGPRPRRLLIRPPNHLPTLIYPDSRPVPFATPLSLPPPRWVLHTDMYALRASTDPLAEDPFAKVLAPPPGESPDERAARLRKEAEAKRVNDEIDERLKQERAAWKKQKRFKLLLLGQSESGMSLPPFPPLLPPHAKFVPATPPVMAAHHAITWMRSCKRYYRVSGCFCHVRSTFC